jgi:hypothetical protein
MFLARPFRLYEVPVMPLESIKSVEKLELVETCSRYDIALEDTFQFNVELVEIPDAPVTGEANIGIAGVAIIVVKLNVLEYTLVPLPLEALTRQ